MPVTLTLDLEDSFGVYASDGRWVDATERLLDVFAELGVTATVFAIAEVARAAPQLLTRAVAEGHEVALHGLRHVALGDVGSAGLADELRRGAAMLADACGAAIRGFRAPIFSLTPSTAWAVDAFADAGLSYSSSVLPARSPLHGWPGLPSGPFRWHNGIVELPVPLVSVAGRRVPLGGIYLRYAPVSALRRRLDDALPGEPIWTYVHPYDADIGAPIRRFPHANWPTSLVLHTRRRATVPRLRRLVELAGGGGPTLGAAAVRLAGAELPQVDARVVP